MSAQQRIEGDFTSRTTFVLATVASLATQRQAQELSVLGLSPKAHGVLTLLRSRGAQAQHELSETMGAAASTIVALVDALEQAGMALRRDDPQDRRRNVVEITDRGRHVAARADTIADRVEHELLAPISAPEQAMLRALLHRLHGAAHIAPASQVYPPGDPPTSTG